MISKNLVSLLRRRAEQNGNIIYYHYIEEENKPPIALSNKELDLNARIIAQELSQVCRTGDRVLMLYPPGLEFINAFFGCLYAGIIAVPVIPPQKLRFVQRLKYIMKDAGVSAITTTQSIYSLAKPFLGQDDMFQTIPWIETDKATDLFNHNSNIPALPTEDICEDDIAFLQYTSGSTGNPKGVMVSHGNIMSNQATIYNAFGHNENSRGVIWLPHFHDMGLIGGVLQALWGGGPVTLMSPVAFIKKPILWLKTISEYRATTSGGPNFAYDLCVDKIRNEEMKGLDLSSWKVAFNGAEPILPSTLNRFSEKFSQYGFHKSAFYPCYGLAEATLIVTGGSYQDEPASLDVDKECLQQGKISLNEDSSKNQKIISCGFSWFDHKVITVNPGTCAPLGEDEIGEIWVQGDSITKGYWNKPELNREIFHAFTRDTIEGPFLKTGDLGFFHKGELYITGRYKDLLIIRGRNYYPQDIESTVSQSHDSLMPTSTAAFSINNRGERLVIVQELKRDSIDHVDIEEVFQTIRKCVANEHEIQVYDIILLKPKSILKTSSGKIERQACKQAYLNQQLEILAQWRKESVEDSNIKKILTPAFQHQTFNALSPGQQKEYLESNLLQYISTIADIKPEAVNLEHSLLEIGCDSINLAEIVSYLHAQMGFEVSMEELFDCNSTRELIEKIHRNIGQSQAPFSTPMIRQDIENRYEPFELNEIQQAYWTGRDASLALGNVACHIFVDFQTSHIDLDRLEKAWQKLIDRHDMLRCIIHPDGEQKIIQTVPPYKILRIDLTKATEPELNTLLEKERRQRVGKILDPQQWPLFETCAYKLPNGIIHLHLYMDMLICDASSIGVLIRDLHHFYSSPDKELPEIEISFRDYLEAEKKWRESSAFHKSLSYWKTRLIDLPGGPQLPIKQNPCRVTKPEFIRRTGRLNSVSWDKLKTVAKTLNITPAVLLMGLFSRILATWSKEPHFCLNLTLFNRLPLHHQINEIIGDFTSLILLEVDANPSKDLSHLCRDIQRQLLRDLDHRHVSGVRVLREMRQYGRQDIQMPVVFTSTLGLGEIKTDWVGEIVYMVSQTPQVWLDHQVFETEGDLTFHWDSVDDLFPDHMLDQMFAVYNRLLNQIAENPSFLKEKMMELLPYEQIKQRCQYNDTAKLLPKKLLPELCMQYALNHPQKEAVVSSGKRLNYVQLHNCAVQLARAIKSRGAAPHQHVAIVLEKGWEQIAAVLGVMYAGSPYLPITLDLPQERIRYLLQETQAIIVITKAEWIDSLHWPESVCCIDVEQETDPDQDMGRVVMDHNPQDLAYTIFTSGSTGTPKGVMITHESVLNTVLDINRRFSVTDHDRLFAISALNFDLSVYDIFGALIVGAAIIVPDEDERKDPSSWFEWVYKENITIWNSAPALMSLLIEEANHQNRELPSSLRLIMMSGDWIPLPLPIRIQNCAADCEIYSLGGATEGSIWSIYYPIGLVDPKWKSIPYGYPLQNQQMYILDHALRQRPDHVPGEIYIGGMGVAKGYYNDPEKTVSRFIFHPQTKQRLYKTGDLGCFRPEGYIEFLGREDNQIQLQGYRVELGEIESILNDHDKVEDSIVAVIEKDNDKKYLVAFVIPKKTAIPPMENIEIPGMIMDVFERIEFKLAQKGLRNEWPDEISFTLPLSQTEILTLSPEVPEEDIELLPKQPLSSHLFSCLLSCFSPIPVDHKPLPKYYYPSAGSLYPVQVYLYIPENSVENLPAGYYYYDRSKHQVVMIQKINRREIDYIELYWIGKLEAIAPMYGPASAGFCFIETGHMYTLFAQHAWASDIGVASIKPSIEDLFEMLKLNDHYVFCQAIRIGYPRDISSRKKQAPVTLSLFQRQSYRAFERQDISKKNFDNFLKVSTQYQSVKTKENPPIYVFIKNRRIESYSEGFYRYDVQKQCLNKIADENLDAALYPGRNQSIYQESAFALFLVGHSCRHHQTERQPLVSFDAINRNILLASGCIGQIMMTGCVETNIGLCPIGFINTEALRDYLHIQPTDSIVYSFLGGLVTMEQTQCWGSDETAAVDDLSMELKQYLIQKLPAYMIPSGIRLIDAFPLTPNGKVDKKALLVMDTKVPSGKTAVAPQNEMEKVLSDIFCEVLGIDQVGIQDNFFALGGHSLLAIQTISKIRRLFSITLPLKTIFEHPTIQGLSQIIGLQQSEKNIPDIPLVDRKKPIPLSFAQERLWILDKYDAQSSAYHNPILIRFYGPLHIIRFEQSIRTIIQRHEILRTNLIEHDGSVFQVIQDTVDFHIDRYDLCRDSNKNGKTLMNQLIRQQLSKPFHLETDLLLRASLYKTAPFEHYLFVNMHHIVSDGWSVNVLTREFASLYHGHDEEVKDNLPALPIQYADYAVWQRSHLSGKSLDKKLQFWKKSLAGIPTLEMPTSYVRPAQLSFKGDRIDFVLDQTLTESIESLSKQQNVTLFMTLLTAFSILLQRYSRQDDIAIGCPVANRNRTEIEPLIGFFVNTLVLRQNLQNNPTCSDLLQQVKKNMLDAYEHQDVPFEKIVDAMEVVRDTSHSPIFQVAFVLQNTTELNLQIPDLDITTQELNNQTSKFDLTMSLAGKSNGLEGNIEYSTDLFSKRYIESFVGHYEQLLRSIIDNPDMPIGSLEIMTKQEKEQLLIQYQPTETLFPEYNTIHERFENLAASDPDAEAVAHENFVLTYDELNKKANQLAHYLKMKNVGSDVIVAICMEKSIDMVISVMAILKAGGAYLPIDPEYPSHRIEYILNDANAHLLLTQKKLKSHLSENNCEIVCIETLASVLINQPKTNLISTSAKSHLANVIYTSGSTGKPKGVMISHGGVANYIADMEKRYQILPTDRILQFSSIGFDIFTEEVFGALLNRATLVIPSAGHCLAVSELYETVKKNNITILSLPTAYWHQIALHTTQAFHESLRLVLIGGEKAGRFHLSEWQKVHHKRIRLVNTYGPTETTIAVTMDEITNCYSKIIPIGKPISNTAVYILDDHLNPVPKGIPGELYIGGAGLAKGYLNKQRETRERFIPNPFGNSIFKHLFRTGDLVRYLEDGRIEYIGRIDDQIKIRGFRVEPGEVEEQISAIDQIKDCIVLAKEGRGGDKFLVAYVVSDNEMMGPETIQATLKNSLPQYMIPSDVVFLASLPLTPNGKVDTEALLAIDVTIKSHQEYIEPRNEKERMIANIFRIVLNVDKVGVEDNFFELGGHSLLAVALTSKIEKAFGVPIKLSSFFESPTVGGIAAKTNQDTKKNPIPDILVPIRTKGAKPPIIAIPGAGGTILGLYELARAVGEDQPFYGIQPFGLNGDQKPLESINAIARANVMALQSITHDDHEIYRLVGHCFGGYVAYEMANLLIQEGRQVEYVAMLDSYPPIIFNQKEQFDVSSITLLQGVIDAFSQIYGISLPDIQLDPENYDERVQREIVYHHLKTSIDSFQHMDFLMFSRMLDLLQIQMKMDYQPMPLNGNHPFSIHIFKVEDNKTDIHLFKQLWENDIQAKVHLVKISGNHFSILNAQNAFYLAKKINSISNHPDI